MPTYHYRCSACGHEFDQFQKFAEEPLTNCPECEGAIRRVVQPVGIVFKGSGWYITDSRDSKTGASKSESTESAKPKESDSKKSTEATKPAAEAASKEKAVASTASSSST